MGKSKTKITINGGSSVLTLLLILFVGLKLTDVIDWSWWWVVSPVWIPIALGLLIAAFLEILDNL